MRTAELEGALLDYWVARAEGLENPPLAMSMRPGCCLVSAGGQDDDGFLTRYVAFQPSSDWAQGGPIVDRERINFVTFGTGPAGENGQAPVVAIPEKGRRALEGPTHLVAAMRAYVASKFGDEVADEVAA